VRESEREKEIKGVHWDK